MRNRHIPGIWEAKLEGKTWKVVGKDGKLIATIAGSVDAGQPPAVVDAIAISTHAKSFRSSHNS